MWPWVLGWILGVLTLAVLWIVATEIATRRHRSER